MKNIRVFISGPYSDGNMIQNIRESVMMANHLIDIGYVPYCPHLTGFMDLLNPKPKEKWLAYDMQWLEQCHCVIRRPGASSGADAEVVRAGELGLPVFTTINALNAYYIGSDRLWECLLDAMDGWTVKTIAERMRLTEEEIQNQFSGMEPGIIDSHVGGLKILTHAKRAELESKIMVPKLLAYFRGHGKEITAGQSGLSGISFGVGGCLPRRVEWVLRRFSPALFRELWEGHWRLSDGI